jgi:S1-C subfamily serine protease
VTNNHVVENAETVEIRTDDAKTHSAKVIVTDPRTDVALIKVDSRSDFPTSGSRTRPRGSATGSGALAYRIRSQTVKSYSKSLFSTAIAIR